MDGNGKQPFYNVHMKYWEQYQSFFPEDMRIHGHHLPAEEYWSWNDCPIHLDRFPASNPASSDLIHGAGGNGRLLAPYARLLQTNGYDVVAPDFPPYGLSSVDSLALLDYGLWVQMLADFVEREIQRDGKPVVLFGVSIGGMLAYHAAVKSGGVKGLIATTFVDTSNPSVRDQLAPNKLVSRAGKWIMDTFPCMLD
ncbi:alpha/beta hydrolase [Paenibacillus chartarius]|uniref:Alpha/beta hydrolase n=1 Tax=Paenibacillus chartarius TaxID=747481 RepID=A0ABV6DIP8_9BACL